MRHLFLQPVILWQTALAGLVVLPLLVGCEQNRPSDQNAPASAPAVVEFPHFENDEALVLGRTVFMERCRSCHESGRDEAPILGDKKLWSRRIERGLEILVRNSINGYIGADGSEMPPRGGHDDLSDEEVAAAVRYMVKAAE